mmetsp:Transcript_8120/g.24462  ORF Transcript_8120/g.24462 Transcript_8120/m.24462 type:complete len:234 (-) Transcript_8120:815-1516(-)
MTASSAWLAEKMYSGVWMSLDRRSNASSLTNVTSVALKINASSSTCFVHAATFMSVLPSSVCNRSITDLDTLSAQQARSKVLLVFGGAASAAENTFMSFGNSVTWVLVGLLTSAASIRSAMSCSDIEPTICEMTPDAKHIWASFSNVCQSCVVSATCRGPNQWKAAGSPSWGGLLPRFWGTFERSRVCLSKRVAILTVFARFFAGGLPAWRARIGELTADTLLDLLLIQRTLS